MNNDGTRTRFTGGATRVLAVFGFIVLIIIGMWGSVRVAQVVPSTLSAIAAAIVSVTSIFVPANETISVSAPSLSVMSEAPVTLAFVHENKKNKGSYSFRFSCVDGVTVKAVSSGGLQEEMLCNTSYPFTPFNNSLTIVPTSTKNRFVDVEVFIAFTPENAGTPTIIGSTVLTIENREVSTSPTTIPPTTTPTKPTIPTTPRPGTGTSTTYPVTPGAPVSDPNGYVDLTARVIEVGVVDKTTGVFTASSTPSRNPVNARPAVRFAIENIGTKVSPQFMFNAVLPTYPAHIFSTPGAQQALNPGDRIEYTIGFDSVVDATQGDIVINIDPVGGINERNKVNNVVRYTVYFNK